MALRKANTKEDPLAFKRRLSGSFRKKLLGVGAPLLEALKMLDLRVRDDEVSFYAADNRLLQMTVGSLTLHHKYAAGCVFTGERRGEYLTIPFNDLSVSQFVGHLPSIVKNGELLANSEGQWEAALVRANTAGTPVIVVDRQVRIPGDKKHSELDLVAVTSGPSPLFVAIELKRNLDNRIQDVPAQLLRYLEMLDPNGAGLSVDVAKAYRIACMQLTSLGRLAPDPKQFKAGMPVRGLLVLAEYNQASKLLARARVLARSLSRPMFFCLTDDRDAPLPPPCDWRPLQ